LILPGIPALHKNNMKATHTPAPWQYDETTYSVWANEGDKKIVRFIPLHEEERANARLIASAPELLAALQIALSDIEDFYQGSPTKDEFCGTEKLIRAAIAKATGEEA